MLLWKEVSGVTYFVECRRIPDQANGQCGSRLSGSFLCFLEIMGEKRNKKYNLPHLWLPFQLFREAGGVEEMTRQDYRLKIQNHYFFNSGRACLTRGLGLNSASDFSFHFINSSGFRIKVVEFLANYFLSLSIVHETSFNVK